MSYRVADDSDWVSASIGRTTVTITVAPLTVAQYRDAPFRITVWGFQRGGFGVRQSVGCLKNWYRDVDNDTFGNPNDSKVSCVQPAGYVARAQDCNDNNFNENPDAIWYADTDTDGLGDPNTFLTQCVQPTNYVLDNTDQCPGVQTESNDCISFIDIKDVAIYLNAGSDQDVDYDGKLFKGDANSAYHNSTQTTENIKASPTAVLFQTERYSSISNILSYTIPVPDGRYTVTTYHNELWFGKKYASLLAGDGKRVFDIAMEGQLRKENFDIHVENTGRPIALTFEDVIVRDGELNVNLTNIVNNATLSGLAIVGQGKVPTIATPDIAAIHLNVGSAVDANYKGTTYLADANLHYAVGNTVSYTDHSASTAILYQSERWNSVLNYAVPVPNGTYTIITRHNELYYRAASGPRKAGAGIRVFAIELEGALVKDNLDLYAENGLNPVALTFEDILVTDGLLNLRMEASADNATISGISIIPQETEGVITDYTRIEPSNENYVYTRVFQKRIKNTIKDVTQDKDVIEQITYFDGLGRPVQQIGIRQSPTGDDILTHIEYDGIGRQDKNYLPFVTDQGDLGTYRTDTVLDDSPAITTQEYYLAQYADDFSGIKDPLKVNAYSEMYYEASPLNRVLEQGAPGADWKLNKNLENDHTVKFDWATNGANEVVFFLVAFPKENGVLNTEKPELVQDNFYIAHQLHVTVTKDENWTAGDLHTSKEYKNKQGQVVLKRTYALITKESTSPGGGVASNISIESHDTYYVYDDFGNLTFVLPPKVDTSDGVSAVELSELCYQYKYDYRNRLFEKKIPGKGKESIIYNLRDEAIATQDANLEADGQWLFNRYDDFGRVAYTGIVNNVLKRDMLQGVANNRRQYAALVKGLDDIVALGGDLVFEQTPTPENPNSRIEVLTINYYDNYNFSDHTAPESESSALFKQKLKTNVTSYPTGSKVRVLGTNNWINTVSYYDYKGRPIYSYSQNEYLSATDIAISKLDFTGRVVQTRTTHIKATNAPIVTIDRFTYDDVGRLLTQTQELNDSGDKERITENSYDALGLLTNKKIGGAAQGALALQDVAYSYNVRGWMTGINDPAALGNTLFGFEIGYNKPQNGDSSLFNGNISETVWNTADTNEQSYYMYSYDALNRIKSASNGEGRGYNLSGVSYDKQGNILGLSRLGFNDTFVQIDRLSYQYDSGNRLLSVSDATQNPQGFKDGNTTEDDYVYDVNGNLTIDKNKGISGIVYNHLNLPVEVPVEGKGFIEYTYDATGVKLSKKRIIASSGGGVVLGTTTYYAGNYVYEDPRGIAELKFFNHPEGYVEPNLAIDGTTIKGFDYVYQFKDHLGNIRLSYSDADNDGVIDVMRDNEDISGGQDNHNEIREVKDYYPFGLTHKRADGNMVNGGRRHNYGFNGKEENYDFGSDVSTLDFGARLYDPAIGRWFVVDALADDIMQIDKSPYAYSWNSPISLNDPDGNCPWCIGAVIGAVSEYAVQVTVNLAKGQSFEDAAFNNVDFVDVAAATVEGALTVGASAVRRIGVRVAAEVVKAAIDVKGDGSTDVIGTEGSNKSAKSLVVDTVIGVAGAEGGDKIAKGVMGVSSNAAVKTAKSNVTAAAKNLDKANNIVFNGGKAAANGSKAKSVSQAFTSFTAAKEAQAITKTLNNTVGQVSENTVKTTIGTAEGVVSTVAAEKTQKIIE